MKAYIKYIITIMLMTAIIICGTVVCIICFPQGVFHSSYQSLIVDKYRMLQNTNEPKIIVIAGSSSSFGLDQEMLEKESGYKVVNLGLHAGFGHLFSSELAKENINQGDIVLLAYEYDWHDNFDYFKQDLVMSGIDDNIDLYKYVSVSHWKDIVGYIFKYAEKKNRYTGSTGLYSREAFDSETTQLRFQRGYVMDYANNVDIYGKEDLSDVSISDDVKDYLIGYKEYVNNKGAQIYFVSPPILKQAIVCDYREFEELKRQEEELIGIPYISDPEDYFFEDELMGDAIYHCNSEGEKIRTELLIEDLKRASIIE